MDPSPLPEKEVTASRSVLIVSFHAYPDPAVGAKRISELANFLSGSGWHVIVAASAGPFQIEGGSLAPQVERVSIRIPRTVYSYVKRLIPDALRGSDTGLRRQTSADSASRPGMSSASRLQHLRETFHAVTNAVDTKKLWSIRLLGCLIRLTRRTRPDVVLVSGPYWSPVLAAAFAAKVRQVPIVVDFRDPWIYPSSGPDQISAGALNTLNAALERWCLRAADAITCTSHSIATTITERVPEALGRIHCIRNGFDQASVISTPAPTGVLRLLFAGTIYFNRNPLPLLEGLASLIKVPGVEKSKIELLMVGECTHWKGLDLKAWCRDHGLGDLVRFVPPVSAATIVDLTGRSNVLVNFAQGQPLQVPGKVFEQIASLRTVLLFSEDSSETSRCVADLPNFIRLDDRPEQVGAALRALYCRFVTEQAAPVSTTLSIAPFSRDHSNSLFEEVLVDAIGCRSL